MKPTNIPTGMRVENYLFFGGRCEEALEFYTKTLGAEVQMKMRFNESPEPHPPGTVPAGWENKVMHASFTVGQSHLMASDGCGTSKPSFDGFSLSINAPSEAEAKKLFAALSDGGEVKMPLTKTFFSPCFGMLTDKFGLGWMIIVNPA